MKPTSIATAIAATSIRSCLWQICSCNRLLYRIPMCHGYARATSIFCGMSSLFSFLENSWSHRAHYSRSCKPSTESGSWIYGKPKEVMFFYLFGTFVTYMSLFSFLLHFNKASTMQRAYFCRDNLPQSGEIAKPSSNVTFCFVRSFLNTFFNPKIGITR